MVLKLVLVFLNSFLVINVAFHQHIKEFSELKTVTLVFVKLHEDPLSSDHNQLENLYD
jgi:hypothetical protein